MVIANTPFRVLFFGAATVLNPTHKTLPRSARAGLPPAPALRRAGEMTILAPSWVESCQLVDNFSFYL